MAQSKLTTRSQEAITAAQRLAVDRGQAALEPLHLLVSLLEGRSEQDAFTRACPAGDVAASRFGAQPSLPTTFEIDTILGA